MKKCITCTHKSVCKFEEAYLDYYDKCNLASEHADKFKVTVDCTHYNPQTGPYLHPSQGPKTIGTYIGDVIPNPYEVTCK